MCTVANTAESKGEEQVLEITSSKRRLKLNFLREAKRMRKSRTEYYAQPSLFDYIREDTAMMQGFFNWLEFSHLSLERIQTACNYFLIHSDETKEEKMKLSNDLKDLLSFNTSYASFSNLIAVKAYYFEDVLNELDEVKAYRDSKAKAS